MGSGGNVLVRGTLLLLARTPYGGPAAVLRTLKHSGDSLAPVSIASLTVFRKEYKPVLSGINDFSVALSVTL